MNSSSRSIFLSICTMHVHLVFFVCMSLVPVFFSGSFVRRTNLKMKFIMCFSRSIFDIVVIWPLKWVFCQYIYLLRLQKLELHQTKWICLHSKYRKLFNKLIVDWRKIECYNHNTFTTYDAVLPCFYRYHRHHHHHDD